MKETKFRRLTREELEEVRDQFVKFLSVNGIDAPTWQQIKAEDPARTDALILQFSQIVFAGVIDKIEYLIERRPHDLRCFRAGADKIEMRGLVVPENSSVDFTNGELNPADIMATLRREGTKLRAYSGERTYMPIGRDQDIFLMMERGALIDPGGFYEVIAKL